MLRWFSKKAVAHIFITECISDWWKTTLLLTTKLRLSLFTSTAMGHSVWKSLKCLITKWSEKPTHPTLLRTHSPHPLKTQPTAFKVQHHTSHALMHSTPLSKPHTPLHPYTPLHPHTQLRPQYWKYDIFGNFLNTVNVAGFFRKQRWRYHDRNSFFDVEHDQIFAIFSPIRDKQKTKMCLVGARHGGA